ncbi:MAG TPA: LysE family transporter [Caldilineae bacterium]|nr:LysE family transporter [Caldilineae bacterium]
MPYAFLGLSLGLSAGLAPGPLLALVIQRSVQGGLASGLRVAVAPLLTDLPIVVLSFLLVGRLPEAGLDIMLGIGGLFVLWLGINAFRHAGDAIDTTATTSARQDFLHGALINFLNPHPYLFWVAVGAPTVVRAWRSEPWMAVVFIVAFYALLIGSKVALAFVFSRARALPQRQYAWLIRFSSFLLFIAGAFMIFAAWRNLSAIL